MMNQDPFKNEEHLQSKLIQDHVTVPDFPMKRKRGERLINYLASPAKNPLEPIISSANGLALLNVLPLLGAVLILIIQGLFFL